MSTFKVDTLQSTTGGAVTLTKQHAAKVWVNFNGTTSGTTIRDSFNVSATTDTASGNYDVTIASAMSNANYSYAGIANGLGSSNSQVNGDGALTSTTIYLRTLNTADNYQDSDGVYIVAHGDLA